ncbi:HNH endonuclease family protein [Microbulbifer pacificus]|uniref:HNH endonuclease family protein n=1 Tax=Microbulbifer pacificus TaxID=407164 RepID=A0AAU0MZR5_9GAMM|nr:HNH endonuclease family protein [Microbulbifer pacificus]WOX05552.1 HNH endonuclease family protein [Microbulbifer pacificus]
MQRPAVYRAFSPFLFLFLISPLLLLADEASGQPYKRHEWLPGWSDFDRDCQDTRHELLIRYSLAPVSFTSKTQCKVASGLWMDPYTGEFYEKASDLDVEHIVPLKWAHDHGAAGWSVAKKRRFAEDPDNLWLVDDGRNQSKGDKGPDRWMPPYGPVRSHYLRRFMAVVNKYGLEFTPDESRIFLAMTENRHG